MFFNKEYDLSSLYWYDIIFSGVSISNFAFCDWSAQKSALSFSTSSWDLTNIVLEISHP